MSVVSEELLFVYFGTNFIIGFLENYNKACLLVKHQQRFVYCILNLACFTVAIALNSASTIAKQRASNFSKCFIQMLGDFLRL